MTEKTQVYRCNICGNIVEVVNSGPGQLVCCGQPMELLEERTADAGTEKHVPYVEELPDGYLVKVGKEVLHPMDDKHYIAWIELIVDGVVHRKELAPGMKPEAVFKVEKGNNIIAREYCTVHGLWKYGGD